MAQMTREDIEFQIHFGYWFNLLNEKFYSRWDLLFNLVQLVGGSAAAAGVMAESGTVVAGSGVALAVCAALSLAWRPGVKAERHNVCKRAFLDLKGALPDLPDAECARRCAQLQMGEAGMPCLNLPAVQITRRSLGDEYDMSTLGLRERWSMHWAM